MDRYIAEGIQKVILEFFEFKENFVILVVTDNTFDHIQYNADSAIFVSTEDNPKD
ncbi:45375_t:CDS:2 [Gigaspora margarita]|uniref:45375_t:CDS:1 n=1 Tax=Gigaspora margarita TaxID=4874 RepID=A0ABM8VY82_GIGMA|nr:45375_t:CDS:2 [Gigaspora margarita]